MGDEAAASAAVAGAACRVAAASAFFEAAWDAYVAYERMCCWDPTVVRRAGPLRREG